MEAVPSYSEHPWLRFYEAGIPAHLEYPDITLGKILSGTASKFSDHTALLFFGKKISYEQLDALANGFAHALTGLGVTKGDRVALMLPNIPQMVIAYYGTLRTGAIAVATNPLYHAHELEVQLKDSGAETLVAVDMFYPVISPVLSRTRVKKLILCGIKPGAKGARRVAGRGSSVASVGHELTAATTRRWLRARRMMTPRFPPRQGRGRELHGLGGGYPAAVPDFGCGPATGTVQYVDDPMRSEAERWMKVVIESMKMEIPVIVEDGGVVTEILVKEEAPIAEGQLVAVLEG